MWDFMGVLLIFRIRDGVIGFGGIIGDVGIGVFFRFVRMIYLSCSMSSLFICI